eukprot:snap_masked-scaffold_44-processed-gene-0.44-mRNA-1 protein AED:1.00 eAED:1.00 QI:0/0/0/0/1/1/2/0/526
MSDTRSSSDINDDFKEDMPDIVKDYVRQLYSAFTRSDVFALLNLYFKGWTDITDLLYKSKEWPTEQQIYQFLNEEENIVEVEELYFRHIFLNGSPMIYHRAQSYENYKRLFSSLLEVISAEEGEYRFNLPIEWVNDMFDECLYQFEDFCSVKHEITKLDPEEFEDLKESLNTWNISELFSLLKKFEKVYLDKNNRLESPRLSKLGDKLGYMAMIGTSRVEVLLGDYNSALKSLRYINLYDKRGRFTQLNSIHITLVYYTGFAFLMTKRYQDSVNLFTAFLLLHNNQSSQNSRCFADSQFSRKCEKISNLLKLARLFMNAVNPSDLPQENNTSLADMSDTDISNIFSKHSPRFINPAEPNLEKLEDHHNDTADVQKQVFLAEVAALRELPDIRSILRMYSTISVEKLASLTNLTKEKLLEALVSIKNRSNQFVNVEDEGTRFYDKSADKSKLKAFDYTSGALTSVSDLHFYIKNDMVHIDEKQKISKFADFFLQNALRLKQCVKDLETQKTVKERRRNNPKKSFTTN